MKWHRSAAVVAAALLVGIGGCASRHYQHPALATDEGPAAEVVIIRKDEAAGALVRFKVLLAGERLVALRAGRWTRVRIHPGQYDFMFEEYEGASSNSASIGHDAYNDDDDFRIERTGGGSAANIERLQLEAGQTYYLLLRHERTEQTAAEHKEIFDTVRVEDTRFVVSIKRIEEEVARSLMKEYKEVRND